MKRCSTSHIIREIKSNQNYNKVSPHTGQNGHHQKSKTINTGEGVETGESSCSVGGNVNWYNYYGEQYGDSLKTRNKTAIWPSNPTTGYIPWENHNWKRHIYSMFIVALFTIARTWKQPRCPSTDEWIKKLWYIYTQWNKKEHIWVSSNEVDEPRTHIQSEVSQKEKDKYSILTHIYRI